MAKYHVRLMFEWGGACLWGMNEAAKSSYGYAEIERVLPLSRETKDRLEQLSKRHDEALDWSDPAAPSPWTKEDFDQFDQDAKAILKVIQTELGDTYSITYEPLGGPAAR